MTAGSESQTAGVLVRDTASTGSRAGSRLLNGWWAGSVLVAVSGAVLTGLAWGAFRASDVTAIACAFLFFPTGTLPSRRWRPVVVLNLLATGLLMIGFILVPRPVALPAPGGYPLTHENPFRVTAMAAPCPATSSSTGPLSTGWSRPG